MGKVLFALLWRVALFILSEEGGFGKVLHGGVLAEMGVGTYFQIRKITVFFEC